MRTRSARVATVFVLALTVAVAACGVRPMTASPSSPNGSASASPLAPAATASSASSPSPAPDGPPAAWLAVEGGDPIEGALGSYTWGDGGSDGPWLHGAPIRVGSGEPLTVTLTPDVPIEAWTIRYTWFDATSPSGAIELATGRGAPAFAPPPAGAWTVELRIVFDDDAGEATYAWAMTVD